MAVDALQRDLSAGKIAPVYVVAGPEELLRRQAVSMIIEAALSDGPQDLNLTRLLWKETDAKRVVAACQTLPMFGDRNVVVVKGVEGLKSDASGVLAEYVAKSSPRCTLVLECGDKAPDMRLKLFKQIKKHGEIKIFKTLYPNQVPAWIIQRVRSEGARIDADAAALLADIVGTELSALNEAVERLYLYVSKGDEIVHISSAHVEKCIARTRTHTVFELTDALGRRRADDATSILVAMLSANEQPIRILAMIARHFRRLVVAAGAIANGETDQEIGRRLNVHKFFLRDFLRQARMFSDSEYEELFAHLFATDKLLKSSRVNPKLHMQRLVVDICTSPRAH